MATGIPLGNDRKTLYCRALIDIGEVQLRYAFDQALKDLDDKLPTIKQLRAWSEQWRPAPGEFKECLAVARTRAAAEARDQAAFEERHRNDPPDPIGETRQEFSARIIEELQGKIKAGHFAMPECAVKPGESYRESLERAAASRNPPSRIPTDPDEKARWARQQARTNGWIAETRQPGEEG